MTPPCVFCGKNLVQAKYQLLLCCPGCHDDLGSFFYWQPDLFILYFILPDTREVEVKCSRTETVVGLSRDGKGRPLARLAPMSLEEAAAYFTAQRIQTLVSYA